MRPLNTVSIIVAASANNVIGKDGQLPWHLPEDLKRFKKITMGKPMIMGRLTFESIGRALPGRRSIVVSRQAGYVAEGCDVVTTPETALKLAASADEVMIIGGGNLYTQLLPQTERIYLTRIHADIDGDTFFPNLESQDWQLVASETLPADKNRTNKVSFEVLERKPHAVSE
jgi:dihydrofolate reductase